MVLESLAHGCVLWVGVALCISLFNERQIPARTMRPTISLIIRLIVDLIVRMAQLANN